MLPETIIHTSIILYTPTYLLSSGEATPKGDFKDGEGNNQTDSDPGEFQVIVHPEGMAALSKSVS